MEGYPSGTAYTTNKNGETGSLTIGGTFTLKHGESITINQLPQDSAVVIEEANGNYTTAWDKTDPADTAATLTGADTPRVTITLTGDSSVTVTNTLNASAPTGISFRHLPYILLLALGMLLIPVTFSARKRKKEENF